MRLPGMPLFCVIYAVIRTMLRFGMAVLVFERPEQQTRPGVPRPELTGVGVSSCAAGTLAGPDDGLRNIANGLLLSADCRRQMLRSL